MGVFSEEVAETVFKAYLAGNPGKWSRAAMAFLASRPELASKAASIIAGEGLREVIFTVAQKLGINTNAELARTLLDAPDNILRGVAEAYVESAKHGGSPPASAQPAAGDAPAGNSKVAVSALVDDFVHRTDPGHASLILCNVFFKAKQAWEKTNQGRIPPQADQQQGSRGKGRGGQQHQTGGKFPQDLYTLEQAKQIGLDECPVCKPFTAAGMAAQEASMAAAASTAAAPAAEAPKPIEGWDKKVNKEGRYLSRALCASVGNPDHVDDHKLVDPLVWYEFSLVIIHELLKDHPDASLRSSFEGGKIKVFTAEQIFALPPTLPDELKERTVRFTFGQGAGKLTKPTQLKELLDSFTNKKKKAEEAKRLKDAQAKVTNAATASDKIDAERELAEVRDELVPKKSLWPRRLIVAGIVSFALLVIVTLVGVAVAMNF